jgi:hypothetical protein
MNNLPLLPKQNKKKEADFGVWLKGYTENNPPTITTALECKQTETHSIPFSEVTSKQIAYGKKMKTGAWIRIQGINGEPDYIYVVNAESYIVIKYPKLKCWIDIDKFVEERDTSKRKSLTSGRAREIATHIIPL